ncbi:MAG: DinB family protein [Flavisolibacter sp.]
MQTIASELQQIIQKYLPPLQSISEEDYALKSSPDKWSKKQILGHLVDSAQNNIRRFICAVYEEQPKVVYNQEQWVEINHYQEYPVDDLIVLWQQLNKQICFILSHASPEQGRRICLTEAAHPLDWLASDYIKHLKHHLHQVLELDAVSYP